MSQKLVDWSGARQFRSELTMKQVALKYPLDLGSCPSQKGILHSQTSKDDWDQVSKSTPFVSLPMKDSVVVNWQRDSSVCTMLRSKLHCESVSLDLLHRLSFWVACWKQFSLRYPLTWHVSSISLSLELSSFWMVFSTSKEESEDSVVN